MCRSSESQMQARTRRDPEAICLRLLSLITSLAPYGPMTARLARRSSESRSSPACCLHSGRHSDGARKRKDQPMRAMSAKPSCKERAVARSHSWDLEIAGLGEDKRPPAFESPYPAVVAASAPQLVSTPKRRRAFSGRATKILKDLPAPKKLDRDRTPSSVGGK